MILSCQNISKSFGTEKVISDVSFHIEEREKAALIGINGAGKTTILRMITGQLEPDSGVISISKGKTLGYLEQHQDVSSTATIYDDMMDVKKDLLSMEERLREIETEMKIRSGDELSRLMEEYNRISTEFENGGGYAVKSEITGILKGLGFDEEDFDRQICTLSGGQKTRLALGKLLLKEPDILLLDEPTNHLDMSSVRWLEDYLLNYNKTVLVVAHDRYFLDRVVTKIIELDNGHVMSFDGNYSDYAIKKSQQRQTQLKAWLNRQQEIRHQEEVIAKLKSFNREKSVKRAESRQKMLDKMEVPEKPSEVKADMHLHFSPRNISGNDVLNVMQLSKSYPGKPLFSGLDFMIRRGEKVAIIGDNGTGKTTILKIVIGMTSPDAGSVRLGSRVETGYYDQEHQQLHMGKTLFDEISDIYPDMGETEIRNMLAAFLFTGDDVYKLVGDLSGGERGRLSLARLMLSGANFLVLDEPTNHLDITSREILEDALINYTGTVLYVSHDRYFINRTATRLMELKDGKLTGYEGNYDYYLEKTEQLSKTCDRNQKGKADAGQISASREDWERSKEEKAKKKRLKNELSKIEDQITQLEERNREIDQMLLQEAVFTDVAKCTELSRNKADLTEELEHLYEKWEELSEVFSENQA